MGKNTNCSSDVTIKCNKLGDEILNELETRGSLRLERFIISDKITMEFIECDDRTVLKMQILHMDERFRNQADSMFKASNGFMISSSALPAMRRDNYLGGGIAEMVNTIFLWGDIRKKDYTIFKVIFLNEEEKFEFIRDLKLALIEWSQDWKGFKEESKIQNGGDMKKITIDVLLGHEGHPRACASSIRWFMDTFGILGHRDGVNVDDVLCVLKNDRIEGKNYVAWLYWLQMNRPELFKDTGSEPEKLKDDKNIKVRLNVVRDRNTLKINVLYMDERFRSKLVGASKRFKASNGFVISSCKKPEISGKGLYLWGYDKESDFNQASAEFHLSDQLDTYLKEMKVALEEWSKQLGTDRYTPEIIEF
jgi:hypothetical protein